MFSVSNQSCVVQQGTQKLLTTEFDYTKTCFNENFPPSFLFFFLSFSSFLSFRTFRWKQRETNSKVLKMKYVGPKQPHNYIITYGEHKNKIFDFPEVSAPTLTTYIFTHVYFTCGLRKANYNKECRSFQFIGYRDKKWDFDW